MREVGCGVGTIIVERAKGRDYLTLRWNTSRPRFESRAARRSAAATAASINFRSLRAESWKRYRLDLRIGRVALIRSSVAGGVDDRLPISRAARMVALTMPVWCGEGNRGFPETDGNRPESGSRPASRLRCVVDRSDHTAVA